ncbi:hypothetical protein [Avibacterium avium]|uniref:hypothetical protein n=1 Tax=Avibacterium avium TaxID=751 RepID=UPI003BF91455
MSKYDVLANYCENDLLLTREEWIERYGNRTYQDINISNLLIDKLIKMKVDFSIKTNDIAYEVKRVEEIIEGNGFSCRVYTENRSVAIGASVISGIGTLIGAASAVAIAAHNLATYDPDFEIGKSLTENKVNVRYKKGNTKDNKFLPPDSPESSAQTSVQNKIEDSINCKNAKAVEKIFSMLTEWVNTNFDKVEDKYKRDFLEAEYFLILFHNLIKELSEDKLINVEDASDIELLSAIYYYFSFYDCNDFTDLFEVLDAFSSYLSNNDENVISRKFGVAGLNFSYLYKQMLLFMSIKLILKMELERKEHPTFSGYEKWKKEKPKEHQYAIDVVSYLFK